MRGANSAPTERVLDVVELLSRSGDQPMRFSDFVRELDLSQATAHAILKTLSDRGWVSRDPQTKVFRPGPALKQVAARLDTSGTSTIYARDVVRRLAESTGMAASVLERSRDHLVITAFKHPDNSSNTALPNEKIPYAPPFGIAFAAWDTADEQKAWVERGAAGDPSLAKRLRDVLARTRDRGYDVDWMTPALAQAAQAIGTLTGDAVPHNLRSVIDQLRVEFASASVLPDEKTSGRHPVATISAPVLDSQGHVQLIVAIHPLQHLTIREVRAASRPLLQEISRVSDR